MSLSLVTAPVEYPILLADVRVQTRREGFTGDDSLVSDFIIPGVVDRAELSTRRQMIEATWDWFREGFPADGRALEIPKPPLVELVEVEYRDTAGVAQTWDASNYVVEAPAGPRCARGRLAPAYGASYPSVRQGPGAVRIRFRAGYGPDPEDVPGLLRQAMLMDAATLYVQRQTVLTGTIVAALPGGVADIYASFCSHPTRLVSP